MKLLTFFSLIVFTFNINAADNKNVSEVTPSTKLEFSKKIQSKKNTLYVFGGHELSHTLVLQTVGDTSVGLGINIKDRVEIEAFAAARIARQIHTEGNLHTLTGLRVRVMLNNSNTPYFIEFAVENVNYDEDDKFGLFDTEGSVFAVGKRWLNNNDGLSSNMSCGWHKQVFYPWEDYESQEPEKGGSLYCRLDVRKNLW